jgi:glutathionyl-hydroquinone reductase
MEDGSYKRNVTSFRNWISSEKDSIFKPEKERYHLYVSLACPWAHRTLIVRALKGLEKVITVSVVEPYLDFSKGWTFNKECQNEISEGYEAIDTVNNFESLQEIYKKAEPEYEGIFLLN